MIRLTNTLTRRKDDLIPMDAGNVRMYVCGPTVYDRAHMGNARAAVVFDVLYRLLRHTFTPDAVTYVRNITDVDDKINARAAESGRSIADITAETTGWFFDDMAALGCLTPDHNPRATQHIPQMIAMIEELIAKGHAYAAEGHALFSVGSYAEYGALSGRTVEDMIAGARVEVAPYKRDPMDFVLWKPSDNDQPGWDSPWGRGRPGWHIECSAMAAELLGARFDIHGGGGDLMFPHHENEDVDGYGAGVFAGYNYDFGTLVMGGEVEVVGGNVSDNGGSFDFNSGARLKLRAGADLGQTLVYGTVGGTYADVDFAGSSIDAGGYLVGAGMEYRITPNVGLGAEVLYEDFGDIDGGSNREADVTSLNLRALYAF